MEFMSRDTLRLLESHEFREAAHQVLNHGGTRTVNGLTIGRIAFAPKESAEEMQARTLKALAEQDAQQIGNRNAAVAVDLAEQIRALKAARDHLRARLRAQIEQWHAMAQAGLTDVIPGDESGAVARWTAVEMCAADLLAILEAPSEQPKEEKEQEKEPKSDAR